MNGTLTTGDISGATALGSIAATEKTVFDHIHSWLVTVDHKRLGLMYIIYALVFFVVAGIEASLIRIQLAAPNNHFLSPQVFNQLFTMHGTTMVFLVGMPMIFGFANYLVPLMIGARDLAFPRLNAFGFWLSVFGGLLLYFSFIGGEGMTGAGSAPDIGWFAYAPLTGKAFSKGHSTDYWILGIMIGGFGSIATAANIITTILSMRCRGMTLAKMPLLAWLNLIMCGMVLIAVSPLTAAQIMLLLDRFAGSHFFDTQAGGSATLWMHFFWIFGHPEVYVLIIPAFAFASEIIPVFSRKPIFGYPVMVAATICIGFIGLSVWAHHMFTIGMNSYANSFFVFTTMAIAVPTGIKIFNWLGTMWGGKIQFKTPILFCLFGAFYYWFPKITGRLLNETLGKLHFWLFAIGFHLTFDSMHIPGLLGMPRRIYTYEPGRGWEIWNLIETIGVFVQGIATLIFVANLVLSYFNGPKAGNDPWDAWTLEWSVSSPPPVYNFASIPTVASRRPLWDLKHPEDPDSHYE